MEAEELKIIDVLNEPAFKTNIDKVLGEIDAARSKRDPFQQYKRNVVDRLKERGAWDSETLAYLYTEVLEKRLEGYSSIECAAIEGIGDEAFKRTFEWMKKNVRIMKQSRNYMLGCICGFVLILILMSFICTILFTLIFW